MTALKPLETLRVKGMEAGVYDANKVCAHPECDEPVPDRGHHIFPRSQIGNGLYFVQAWGEDGKELFDHPIPHVVGLCREHHDAVERHDAWIKLEGSDFVWYEREPAPDHLGGYESNDGWRQLGPLDPQPGGRAKVKKPKRPRLKGEERKKRETLTIRFPEGVDGEYVDQLFEDASRIELEQPDTKFDPALGTVAKGALVIALLERFVGRA